MRTDEAAANVIETLRPLRWLIVVVGVIVAIGASGIWRDMFIPLAIVSVAGQIVIYGRITARLVDGRTSDSLQILKEHGRNAVVAKLLIIAPVFVLRLLMTQFEPSALEFIFLSAVGSAAVAVATIYVLPVVFLYRKSLGAFVAGIAYLRNHFEPVAWAAAVVAVAILFHSVGGYVFWRFRVPWSFVVLLASGVLLTGGLAVAFSAALTVVLDGRRQVPENNASEMGEE